MQRPQSSWVTNNPIPSGRTLYQFWNTEIIILIGRVPPTFLPAISRSRLRPPINQIMSDLIMPQMKLIPKQLTAIRQQLLQTKTRASLLLCSAAMPLWQSILSLTYIANRCWKSNNELMQSVAELWSYVDCRICSLDSIAARMFKMVFFNLII